MAMKEFRDGAVAFDSKAKELLDLLGADQLRVPVGMMGFYWGMGAKECRANLGPVPGFGRAPGRRGHHRATRRLSRSPRHPGEDPPFLQPPGRTMGHQTGFAPAGPGRLFPLCENLEIEIGAELGMAGLRKTEGGADYTMTRKRDWGRFTVTGGSPAVQQDLPVVSAEGFGPAAKGWFRFTLANHLYREYVDPANASITPPRWREETFLAGR